MEMAVMKEEVLIFFRPLESEAKKGHKEKHQGRSEGRQNDGEAYNFCRQGKENGFE